MKTLNLLQNMSAEAKALAMALPMLLLGSLSAMAQYNKPGINEIHIIDMPPGVAPQPSSPDSVGTQQVEQPNGNALWYGAPSSQKPEDAGLDHWYVGRGFPGPPVVSSDSASAQPVDYRKYKLPGQKPEDAGLDNYKEDSLFIRGQVSPDTTRVQPVGQPDQNLREIKFPGMKNDEPEQDIYNVPAIPGNDDVYESQFIDGNRLDPAGIAEVAADNQPSKQAQGVYTLSGILVSDNADLSGLAPGLYIVNGKKMLVR